MNKFIGVGNLTKEGELRSTESGKIIYSNSLAMRNDFKNKDGEYDTEFINFSAWGTTAEYLKKYAKKGNKVLIEGRIATRSYDSQDGAKRYVFGAYNDVKNFLNWIYQDSIVFLDRKYENYLDFIQNGSKYHKNKNN